MPTDRVHRLPQQAQPRAITPHRPQPSVSDAATRPRHAHPDSEREALHPLRRAAPVTSRCTRSEGVQCLQIGCTASHNKHNRGHSLPTDPNRPPRTQPHGLDMLTPAPNERRYTRYVAKHPLRRTAPDQKGCNAYRSGAPPPTTSATADTPSPQTPTGSIGPSHTASTCSPRLRTRGATPVTSRNTRYVAVHPIRRGAMPTDRVQHHFATTRTAETRLDSPPVTHSAWIQPPHRSETKSSSALSARFNPIGSVQPDQNGLNLPDRV